MLLGHVVEVCSQAADLLVQVVVQRDALRFVLREGVLHVCERTLEPWIRVRVRVSARVRVKVGVRVGEL